MNLSGHFLSHFDVSLPSAKFSDSFYPSIEISSLDSLSSGSIDSFDSSSTFFTTTTSLVDR